MDVCIEKIKNELKKLDNNLFDTVDEAKKSILEYERLLDSLVCLIIEIIDKNELTVVYKEDLFMKSVKILSNYIGSADDTEKYEAIFIDLYENNKISKTQLDIFYDNLNLGRWE